MLKKPMWNNSKAIVHLDMDAYFASVEQLSNPMFRGKPVIITGSGKRTVVATASYEARKYGVKTGMTISQAKGHCPHAIRVIGNPEKYIYTTLKIRKALVSFTDQVELYSIDEFFADVTHSQLLFGPPEEMIRKIKAKVREMTSLPCSCGIAPNKLMAKFASTLNKPDGLTVIYPDRVADILRDLPVERLHGIGGKVGKYLGSLGITSAKELGDASISLLTAHFGVNGYMLKDMGNGISRSPVSYYWQRDKMKSIGHSYTLPADTLDSDLIRSYIFMLCQRVTTKLRRERKFSRTVVLTIRYDDFKIFSRRKTVDYLLDTIYSIYCVCLMIFRSIGKLAKPVRLLGVSVTSLTAESKQLYLFDKFDEERKLDEAIREINARFGEFTIKPASLLLIEEFERQKRQLS